jgi:hypothetical protein
MTRREWLKFVLFGGVAGALVAAFAWEKRRANDVGLADQRRDAPSDGSVPFDWAAFLSDWNEAVINILCADLQRRGILDRATGEDQFVRTIAEDNGIQLPNDILEPIKIEAPVALPPKELQARLLEIANEQVAYTEKLILKLSKVHVSYQWYFWEIVKNRGLAARPASSEEISKVEQHYGVVLPPSYKEFLKHSNGWRASANTFVSINDVAWFRDKYPEDAREWSVDPPGGISDEKYFVYGKGQESAYMRGEYVPKCLVVSEPFEEMNDHCLLNPAIAFSDGEWEAWYLAPWLPGAKRFRSFKDLMVWRRDRELRSLASRPKEMLIPQSRK